jgi:hypothetical protein
MILPLECRKFLATARGFQQFFSARVRTRGESSRKNFWRMSYSPARATITTVETKSEITKSKLVKQCGVEEIVGI